MNIKPILVILSFSLLLTTSCIKQPGWNHAPSDNNDYFDFKIDRQVALSIDYGFPNKDYTVLFEIYDQDPLIETQVGKNGEKEVTKRDIEPVYRAATDLSGKFSAEIQALSSLSEVWLYSEYPGTLSPVRLEIEDNKISFDQNAYIEQLRNSSAASALKNGSRAITGNDHTYPDGWFTLGD